MSRIIEPAGTPVEPVSTQDIKKYLFIDEDDTTHDEELEEMITSERQRMERHLNIAMVDRTGIVYDSDGADQRVITVPYYRQIEGVINFTDVNDSPVNVLYTGEKVKIYGGRVKLSYNVKGFAPAALKRCLKKLVATAFKYRENLYDNNVNKLQDDALTEVEYFSNNLPL